jgi:primosomal protein N' (replication factor Y) (superfamily II helicase)
MPPDLLADVAVRAPFAGADPVFTYRVPPGLRAAVRPGQLVWAPLRRQRVQGIILDLYDGAGPPELRPAPDAPRDAEIPTLRDLADVADPEAALTTAQIRLARWVSERYRAPLYETLALMLPPGVSQEAEPTWRATAAGMQADLGVLPENERAVLYYLRRRGELPERELRKQLRGSDAELRATYVALLERGFLARGAAISAPRARPRLERLARPLLSPAEMDKLLPELERAPKQRTVVEYLSQQLAAAAQEEEETRRRGEEETNSFSSSPLLLFSLSDLYAATGADAATMRALERRGVIELTSREVRRDPLSGDAVPPDVPPALTAQQQAVWQQVAAALDASSQFSVLSSQLPAEQLNTQHSKLRTPSEQPQLNTQHSKLRTFLLHGVTGSGKTEVYLRAIGRALRQGRQALVLVPEIALTAQLVRRFAARFPGALAVLHSGLSLGERYDEWRRLRSGVASLAIGSRSAVFAPLPKLGLIIVDEEHEASYKHDAGPRYHARDAAMHLAEITGSVLILGSATPAVETYAAATSGRIALLELPERVGTTRGPDGLPRSQSLPMPAVRIVDMRRELQSGNRSIFSRPLQDALHEALERGEQAVLFLNRRGAASFVMCRDCGHVVSCPNCSSPLTVHYDNAEGRTLNAERPTAGVPAVPHRGRNDASAFSVQRSALLVCHTCSHRELTPAQCPQCWSPRVKSFGVGTQRVVEEVEALYPQARTLRWDRDTVTRKGDHGRMLDAFLQREADVLVGTQMIAKGLDLPFVSTVGVVAADTGLHLPDFRAGERTFQLLTQVAGRAGRRSAGAKVVIQTYNPEHYALLAAQEHDYRAFFAQELSFRQQTGYPPIGRLVRFVYAGTNDERSRRAAEALADELRRIAANVEASADGEQLGGWGLIGPAPAFFHRQRNRFRWHLLLRARDPAPVLERLRLAPGWTVDVDPVHVL